MQFVAVLWLSIGSFDEQRQQNRFRSGPTGSLCIEAIRLGTGKCVFYGAALTWDINSVLKYDDDKNKLIWIIQENAFDIILIMTIRKCEEIPEI